MGVDAFSDSQLFTGLLLPLLIVISRVIDVSIGTLRIIFVSKGMRLLAPVLGFFEILIWLLAISQIMQNLTNFMNYIAYAFGFALGNYIGIRIEERIALGTVVMRVITQKDATALSAELKKSDLKWTILDAEGSQGPVNVLFTVLKRSDIKNMVELIKVYNPNAMYTVEDIRSISDGFLPPAIVPVRNSKRFPLLRKSK